jgi:hypothetical protein
MALSANSVLIIALISIAILLAWIIRLEWKLHRLLLGKNGKTLEDSIVFARNELERLNTWKGTIERYLAVVERRLSKTLHEAKTVRFNAFKGTGEGGNQSFASAFLTEEGNGVVISSMYARDRVSVFAKPVEKKASTYDLTDEERESIEKASASIENTKR